MTPDLKPRLYEACRRVLEARADSAQANVAAARESAANETKSSAGDKYETAREMMQQEINRDLARLEAARQELAVLARIRTDGTAAVVLPGSIVMTSAGAFYIAVSAGTVVMDGITYNTVSAAAPVARLLLGRSAGDAVSMNGKEIRIERVC